MKQEQIRWVGDSPQPRKIWRGINASSTQLRQRQEDPSCESNEVNRLTVNPPLSALRIAILTPTRSSRHGGSFDLGVLIEVLRRSGALVQHVGRNSFRDDAKAQRENASLPINSITRTVLRFFGAVKSFQIFISLLQFDIIIIVGDLPRITYLVAQRVRPLIFVRQDTILTCPANNRILHRSGRVCSRSLGVGCFSVDTHEHCMKDLGYLRRFGRFAYRVRDRWLLRCLSHFVTNSLSSLRQHSREGVVIYPPCVGGGSLAAPKLRDGKRIAFVGRLDAVKGASHSIAILQRLPVDVHLHLIGDGAERQQLALSAREEGLEGRVTFHGWLSEDERNALVSSVHVVLVCSLWDEAFGRIGPESFAVGTPVVAYDAGGISEWCRPPAGRLVPVSDVPAAAAAVGQLLDDETAWQEASSAAVAQAAEFSNENFADRWIDYLTKTLDCHPKVK